MVRATAALLTGRDAVKQLIRDYKELEATEEPQREVADDE